MSEEAGKEVVKSSKSLFAGSVGIEGLEIQLKNAQSAPSIISRAKIPIASQSVAGAMSAADKTKLDGVAAGANKYVLPVAGKALGGVKTTSDVASASGYTPSPIVDGVVYYKDTTYPPASQSAPGTMSAADKRKLDGVAEGATRVVVDAALDAGSANAVQNKAVKSALDGKAPTESPALTGSPTAPTPPASDKSTRLATTAYVAQAVEAAVTSASAYQGAAESYAQIVATAYKPGWYWVVKVAGSYAGQPCEVGDMVFANTAKGSVSKESDFDVIQSNITFVTAEDVRGWF